MAALPYSDSEFLKEAGNSKGLFGEVGYTTLERTSARPTLDVNGIWGGFSGVGAKTIIPAEAHAKVSMRLVADQEPAEIAKQFTDYVMQIAPSGVEVKVQFIHDGDGILIDTTSHYIRKAAEALSTIWGKQALFGRSGGSIPIAALIKKKLGIDPVLMGYGQPGDALHSPNERFSVDQFYKGIECNKILYQSCAN
jgi:acetylornithine deacetylase/succinyl-diaminopimelate desuccinylase-like protein